MTTKRTLVVVPNDAKPKPRKYTPPKPTLYTVTDAASLGSRRDLLVSMRSRVATAVEDFATPARDLAALTRRLMEIAKEIDAIDVISKQESEENATSADEKFDSSAI